MDEDDHQAWGIFITPASDCTIIDTWTVIGLRGTASHDYTIADIFVPERRMFKFITKPTSRPKKRETYLAAVAPMMPAVSLGVARAACTHAVQASVKAVDMTYAAAGGTAIYTECELERYFREIHTAAAHFQMRPATTGVPTWSRFVIDSVAPEAVHLLYRRSVSVRPLLPDCRRILSLT